MNLVVGVGSFRGAPELAFIASQDQRYRDRREVADGGMVLRVQRCG